MKEFLQTGLRLTPDLEASDPLRTTVLVLDFHLKIAESCGNPVLPMIIQPIYDFMPRIKSLIYANITHVKSTAQQHHQKILNMILEKDSDGAFEAMKEHMLLAEAHAQAMLKSITNEMV